MLLLVLLADLLSPTGTQLAAHAERLVSEGWTFAEVARGCRMGPDGRVSRIFYDATIEETPREQRQIMHDALVSRA